MASYRSGRKSGFHLSPSVLSADFSKLGEDVKAIADATYVHLDVMDGAFVPNISFGPGVIKSVRGISNQVFDVHLMINEPVRYLDMFEDAGADIISVHVEACGDVAATLKAIRDKGIKASLALNPETDITAVYPYLDQVDMILIMSVHPGFGGQSFIEDTIPKAEALSEKLIELGLQDKVDVEVDGGLNLNNVGRCLDAGINIIVAGSSVYKGDISSNIQGFKDAFNK